MDVAGQGKAKIQGSAAAFLQLPSPYKWLNLIECQLCSTFLLRNLINIMFTLMQNKKLKCPFLKMINFSKFLHHNVEEQDNGC